MAARLENLSEGKYAVHGNLDFQSVASLWGESLARFRKQPPLCIDLREVGRSDSSGVALLVAWLSQARALSQDLQFLNIPVQMQAIIKVADLDELFPAN